MSQIIPSGYIAAAVLTKIAIYIILLEHQNRNLYNCLHVALFSRCHLILDFTLSLDCDRNLISETGN